MNNLEKVKALLRDIVNGLYPHDFKWIEHACKHYLELLEKPEEEFA